MAIISSGSFAAANSKIAGATFVFTSSLPIQAGQLGVLFVASDNLNNTSASNTVTSVIDNFINYNLAQGTGFNATARTVISQSDGKILVGGDFTTYNNQSASYIARLNTDGTLDTSFSYTISGSVYKLAIQPDVDKIIAAGTMPSGAVRLNSDGTVDSSFNTGTGFNAIARTVIVQPTDPYVSGSTTYTNKLIFGGDFTSYNGTTYSGSARIDGGGAIDTSFNIGAGFSPVDVRDYQFYSSSTCLLAVGNFTSVSGSTRNRIALLNASNGSLIPTSSFNIGAGFNVVANSIAIQRDNKITVVGNFTTYSGSTATRIARINTDGTNDTTFVGGAGLNVEANTVKLYPPISSNVWTVGGALINVRGYAGSTGTQNEGLAFGGGTAVIEAFSCTEEYNGTSWATGGALIVTRNGLGGAGTQNEGLAFGGSCAGKKNSTEEYDGTSWTASGNMIQSRASLAGAGTQNAAFGAGGDAPGQVTCTEEYNGTSWATGGALITARVDLKGAGTQNEGLVFAGFLGVSPFANLSCTEEYNGTSWTAGGALITARASPGGAGTQNAGLVFGGSSPGRITCTEEYNGTTWAVGGALITPIFGNNGAGTQTSALSFGGTTTTNVYTTNTEEYSANPFDRLLVGGTFTTYSGSTQRGSVRIRESGSRDTTFVIGSGFETAVDVKDFLINTDNSIIAVGGFTTYSASFSPQPNRIIKIRANGAIDASVVRNTWSKLAERTDGSAAGAGATIALFYITSSYLIYPGTSITATMAGSVTARAATGWVYGTDTSAIAYTGSVTSSQTSDIGLLTLSDLTSGSGEYLFVRGVAIEDDNATLVMTPTSNFSTMSSAGTTGGTAITNQSVRSEFRIITTASLASFPTSNINTSNASIYFTFYETVIPRRRTYFILLD